MQKVYINGETIKTKGTKYFHYHGKRLLIANYLVQKNIENVSPVTCVTGDKKNINETKYGKKVVSDKSIVPPISIPVTGDTGDMGDTQVTQVSFNTKTGGIELHSGKGFTPSNINTPSNQIANDKRPDNIGENNKREVEVIDKVKDIITPKNNMLGILLPAALIGAGMMLKGVKGSRTEFREQSGSSEW